jgi:hypothetical protein
LNFFVTLRFNFGHAVSKIFLANHRAFQIEHIYKFVPLKVEFEKKIDPSGQAGSGHAKTTSPSFHAKEIF